MRCTHCEHVVTAEKKLKRSPKGATNEHVYSRCSQYNAPDHSRIWITERTINDQFVQLFERLRVEDLEVREWLVAVIRARASAGRQQNAQHRAELERQKPRVEFKLQTLLNL